MKTSACAFSGCSVRVEEDDCAPRRQAREVEALAPDEHQVGRVANAARPAHRAEQRARRRGVRILVRADQQVVLERLARLRHAVGLDERGEALARAPA